MKKILGISLVAMMAVTTARAEIASKQYVDAQDSATLTSAQNFTTGKIGTLPNQPGTETPYATVADAIAGAVAGGTANVVTYSGSDDVGGATTPVYVADGVVTAGTALGTMAYEAAADYTPTSGLGALATLDAVGSAQITNGAIMAEDINASAGIAATQLASGVQTTLTNAAADHTTIGTYGDIVTHNASEFASAEQGAAAESAIQGVKVNGSALTATDGVVDVTVPTGALASLDAVGSAQITNGAIMAEDINASAGIAATQLASDVQTSLGLADTSLQKTTTVAADGQYVLTKKVTAGVASYAWEMITRTGNEGTAPATTGEQ